MNYHLTFKWSPRGYKGNAGLYCRLYVNGLLVGSAGGGGYDMKGTCIGQWLDKQFTEELIYLAKKEMYEAHKVKDYYNARGGGIYGLIVSRVSEEEKPQIYCDGACGIRSMFEIVGALGYEVGQSKKILSDGTIKWLDGYDIYKPTMREFEAELKELAKHQNPNIKRHSKGLLKALKVK